MYPRLLFAFGIAIIFSALMMALTYADARIVDVYVGDQIRYTVDVRESPCPGAAKYTVRPFLNNGGGSGLGAHVDNGTTVRVSGTVEKPSGVTLPHFVTLDVLVLGHPDPDTDRVDCTAIGPLWNPLTFRILERPDAAPAATPTATPTPTAVPEPTAVPVVALEQPERPVRRQAQPTYLVCDGPLPWPTWMPQQVVWPEACGR